MSKLKNRLIRETAKELGLPVHVVREAVESQFSFVAEQFKSNLWNTIKLPGLFQFEVKPRRAQLYNTHRLDR